MAPDTRPRMNAHAGFTYIGVLLLVALMGMVLASFGTLASMSLQREREQELLFVGGQFRHAIGLYYEATPGPVKRYPPSLEALVRDARGPSTQRYLRRIYPDPISGKAEWGVVAGPGGEVTGVYSLSEKQPIKSANFNEADQAFEGQTAYSGWKFTFLPPPIPATSLK